MTVGTAWRALEVRGIRECGTTLSRMRGRTMNLAEVLLSGHWKGFFHSLPSGVESCCSATRSAWTFNSDVVMPPLDATTYIDMPTLITLAVVSTVAPNPCFVACSIFYSPPTTLSFWVLIQRQRPITLRIRC